MVKGLGTVIYQVPDLARAKAWYSTAFQLQPYLINRSTLASTSLATSSGSIRIRRPRRPAVGEPLPTGALTTSSGRCSTSSRPGPLSPHRCRMSVTGSKSRR